MCIRDRAETALAILEEHGWVQGMETDNPTGRPTTRYAINPVSYTHLRAHETVLDLVCRILLENKKKNNKHTTHYISYN